MLNLRAQNNALLLKFVDKFYNHINTPWVHLTWKAFYVSPTPPHLRRIAAYFWWWDIIVSFSGFEETKVLYLFVEAGDYPPPLSITHMTIRTPSVLL